MSDNPIAVVLAGIGVLSLCAVCALGPVVLGSAVGWAFGWITDLSPMVTTGVAIFTALVVYALFRRWGAVRSRENSESANFPNSTERES
jgi:choline-glycine betaine transporter